MEERSDIVEVESGDLWDTSNPRSMYNLLTDRLQEHVKKAMEEHPNYFESDEHELHKMLSKANLRPNPMDNMLRMKFWMEYEEAQLHHKKSMDIKRVFAGVCSAEYFYKRYLKVPSRVAWMFCKPMGYSARVEEALEFAATQIRDILEQPHVIDGKLNVKIAEVKMKAYSFLHTIVKGSVVQKTMQLNVHTTNSGAAKTLVDNMAATSMDTITDRLNRLRLKERLLENGGIGRQKEAETVSVVSGEFTEAAAEGDRKEGT